MKIKTEKAIRCGFYAVCFSALFAAHASAYIDPATTSYIIQIVVGVVVACGTAAGIIFNKLRRKMKKKTEEEAPVQAAVTGTAGAGGVITADDLLSDEKTDE